VIARTSLILLLAAALQAQDSRSSYTITTVVRVMRPAAAIDDDFQEARVRRETDGYVELEVVHHPFSNANAAIVANARWREDAVKMHEWLEPGATANFDERMRHDVLALVGDVSGLDDKQLVERAAKVVLGHAAYDGDGFTTFFTAFDAGRPFVPEDIRKAVEDECRTFGRTIEQQWHRDLFAKSMFANKVRGSCTSTAIYLTACLRALGIPTRIVLCIPAVDATDDRQLDLVRKGISNEPVRRTILAGLEPLRDSWTSHTFNEVWVGGRWRRLDGTRLGRGILDSSAMGLITHVGTFRDWADANAAATIGRRQKKREFADAFFGLNPYRAMAVQDHGSPPAESAPAELRRMTIDSVVWSDDETLEPSIRKVLEGAGDVVLLGHVREWRGFEALKAFMLQAGARFFLDAPGSPSVTLDAGAGGITNSDGSVRWIVMRLAPEARRRIASGTAYALRPENAKPPFEWAVADGLRVEGKAVR
jgi:hypothetical protein